MARVVAIGTDLMLASRVTTALAAAGHQVEQRSTLPDELDGVDLVVADLDGVEPERLADLGVPVLGFHQHTDVETKSARRGRGPRPRGSAQPHGPGAAGARRPADRR